MWTTEEKTETTLTLETFSLQKSVIGKPKGKPQTGR